MRQIYLLAKQLHRITMWAVLVLGLVMTMTGLLMKFTQILIAFPVVPAVYVRYIHNQLSFVFALILGLMMLTGVVMYFGPGWIQAASKQTSNNLEPKNPVTEG